MELLIIIFVIVFVLASILSFRADFNHLGSALLYLGIFTFITFHFSVLLG